MSAGNHSTLQSLAQVPEDQRERIVSGMRWTLWFTVLGAPFGYGTSVLLARLSPEALGTYGLLLLYIALVSSWFYFGGDAVVIKFVPELPAEKRISFALSYWLVVCASLLPWLLVSGLWPDLLHFFFGKSASTSFQALLICLAPIGVASSIVLASLKGALEIYWAQILRRVLTLGSFLIYGALFLLARGWLRAHYMELVWGVYLALTGLATVAGFLYLARLKGWESSFRDLRFYLPRGFWKYTLSLQQVSALNFLLGKLDYILVLNFGGLALLGKYVAIITLAEFIRVVAGYFLETLLPALTNLLASRNVGGASEVFSMNLRILFAVSLIGTAGLLFLTGPITRLLGPEYLPLRRLFALMVLFIGISTPGSIGGTLLTSVGKQQRSVWVGLFQLALYAGLFAILWPRYQLLGAVLAYGISLVASNMLLLAVARASVPIKFSAGRDYAWLVVVGVLAGLAAIRLAPPGLTTALFASTATVGLFLMLARYGLDECRELVSCFVLGRLKLARSRREELPTREIENQLA